MRIICILCDRPFEPTRRQIQKLKKHPHKIQICSDCYERIKQKVLEKRQKQSQSND